MIHKINNQLFRFLSIEFSYDLNEWYKRKARFNTYSNNLKISQITVMLYCVGYTGKVMFRDVIISPTMNRTKDLMKDDIVSDCKTSSTYWNGFNLPEYKTIEMNSFTTNENENDSNKQVTLVSQVSMDRMQILERTLINWKGSISLAVHVPVKDIKKGLDQWQL